MQLYVVPYTSYLLVQLMGFVSFLSANEIKKWNALSNPKVKLDYVASKLLTRYFLSKYTNWKVHPKVWEFSYLEFDKPIVSNQINDFDIHFNVSHCSDLFVISIDENTVGVDVESFKFKIDDDLAATVFSKNELEESALFSSHEKHNFYLKLWTLKESFSKENGSGINTPFTSLNTINAGNGFYKIVEKGVGINTIYTTNLELTLNSDTYSLSVSGKAERLKKMNLQTITHLDVVSFGYATGRAV